MSLSAAQITKRRGGLGASEIAAVAGLNPWMTALDVWLSKKGLVEFAGNEATKWGNRLESAVADEYAERHGCDLIESDTRVHPRHEWMLATPDRLIVRNDTPAWDLQIKCTNVRQAHRWGESGTDQVPDHVAVQCNWELAVTGLDRCDVAVLIGGNEYREYTLARDLELEQSLIAIGQEFWERHMLGNEPPAIDGSDSSRRYLERLHAEHTGLTKPASDDTERWFAQWEAASAMLKAAKEKKEEAENQLRAAIGDARAIEGGWGKATWTTVGESVVREHVRPAYRRLSIKLAASASGKETP